MKIKFLIFTTLFFCFLFQKNLKAEYPISVENYCAFLNAQAVTDNDELYDEKMESDCETATILRKGIPGYYSYSAVRGREKNLVAFISCENCLSYSHWEKKPFSAQRLNFHYLPNNLDLSLKSNYLQIVNASLENSKHTDNHFSLESLALPAVILYVTTAIYFSQSFHKTDFENTEKQKTIIGSPQQREDLCFETDDTPLELNMDSLESISGRPSSLIDDSAEGEAPGLQNSPQPVTGKNIEFSLTKDQLQRLMDVALKPDEYFWHSEDKELNSYIKEKLLPAFTRSITAYKESEVDPRDQEKRKLLKDALSKQDDLVANTKFSKKPIVVIEKQFLLNQYQLRNLRQAAENPDKYYWNIEEKKDRLAVEKLIAAFTKSLQAYKDLEKDPSDEQKKLFFQEALLEEDHLLKNTKFSQKPVIIVLQRNKY